MRYLELTLDEPAANLALDEALLEEAELSGDDPSSELLRVWEPKQPFVVLGRSSLLEQEVNVKACQQLEVPVLRRVSGGATIVTGPGCLMYAVLLSYSRRPDLRLLDRAHQTVMENQRRAIQSLGIDCSIQGICDLTLGAKKFSGNSLRCRRNFLLYHGTILYDFPLSMLGTCLGTPQRQPDYRQQRTHLEFVTNIEAAREEIVRALRSVWDAGTETATWPELTTSRLATEKYSRLEWTSRH